MKQGLQLFIIELTGCLILALLFNQLHVNYDFLTLLGLINFIVSVLGLFIGLIMYATGNKNSARNICLAGGLLLFIGISTCSFFPLRLYASNIH